MFHCTIMHTGIRVLSYQCYALIRLGPGAYRQSRPTCGLKSGGGARTRHVCTPARRGRRTPWYFSRTAAVAQTSPAAVMRHRFQPEPGARAARTVRGAAEFPAAKSGSSARWQQTGWAGLRGIRRFPGGARLKRPADL